MSEIVFLHKLPSSVKYILRKLLAYKLVTRARLIDGWGIPVDTIGIWLELVCVYQQDCIYTWLWCCPIPSSYWWLSPSIVAAVTLWDFQKNFFSHCQNFGISHLWLQWATTKLVPLHVLRLLTSFHNQRVLWWCVIFVCDYDIRKKDQLKISDCGRCYEAINKMPNSILSSWFILLQFR